MFACTGQDRDGRLSWEEFVTQLEAPGIEKFFESMEIEPLEARGLFFLLDTDESGFIDAEEFTQGFLRLRGPARAIDVSTLIYFNKRVLNWWQENMRNMGNE